MKTVYLKDLPPAPAEKAGWPWKEEPKGLVGINTTQCNCPKITIVTPCYNHDAYLEETIRSVLLQNYPNLEYIVIDGGSKDASIEIIKKYTKWIDYWVSEKDSGQSEAINKGFKRAKGEILAWLNSDDLYEPGALHRIGCLYQKHKGKVIAGQIIDFDHTTKEETLTRQYNISFEKIVKFWEGNHWWHQPGMFFPAGAVRQVGYLDENLHFGMDYDLLCRLTRNCETLCIEDTLARFRMHNASKTVSNRHLSMYESSVISKKYWHLLGLKTSNAHDRIVTLWFVKRANYFFKRLYWRIAYKNIKLSLSISKKYTVWSMVKELLRMLKGGRFTSAT